MDTTPNYDAIYEIAEEFDRLCPSQVDRTPCDCGHGYEAGHVGHEPDAEGGPAVVGWFCAAGNAGHPLAEIPVDCLQATLDRLRGLADGALDSGGVDELIEGCGGKWIV